MFFLLETMIYCTLNTLVPSITQAAKPQFSS